MRRIEAEHPGRAIALVVPELAGGRWYDFFLHNQRTTALARRHAGAIAA